MVDLEVPPIGVGPDQSEGLRSASADDDGYAIERYRLLLGLVELEVLAVVVDRLAPPQRRDRRRGSRPAGRPGPAAASSPTPKLTSSPGTEPKPRPSSNRPPEALSRVTAWRASTAGCRRASHNTRCPTTSRSVCAATQVAVVIASCIGCASAIGGARWSMNAMPVKPAASAARARSTIASMGRRIWGRNRKNSLTSPLGGGDRSRRAGGGRPRGQVAVPLPGHDQFERGAEQRLDRAVRPVLGQPFADRPGDRHRVVIEIADRDP